MLLVFVFRFFLFSHLFLLLCAVYGNGNHDECPRSFDCGKLGTIQFPGLSEENKRIFEDDYSQISQIVYSGNTNFAESGYLVDFRGQYPKIIIHKAEKLSMNIIKSLYDLGYVSRIYFKDIKVLGLLPKPIKDAVTKFRSVVINDEQVSCIKIWKTSPEYSATGGELVEISPARHLSTKFKDGGEHIPNFDAEFIAKRRAFTIIEYWEALEKRVISGKGWTYHVSEKMVVLCKKDRPFQEVVLKQLAAYARKIPLMQVAGSTQMRRYLCRYFQTKKTSHRCNYCKEVGDTTRQQESQDKIPDEKGR